MQRLDAPALDVVHVDVERGLVELDHVDPVLLERTCFLVEELGERHRQLHLVAIVLVRNGVDDGHRPRQGELELPLRMGTCKSRFRLVYAALQAERLGHHRHHGFVAVVPDAHLHFAREVDALDRLEEAMDEVLTRLLAVGDDLHAGVFLRFEPQQRGIALGLGELLAARAPGRPELRRLGEPRRLGQAAGDGRLQHEPPIMVGRRRVADQRRCHFAVYRS